MRATATAGGALAVVTVIGVFMWGAPQYGVYSAEMRGLAELKQAEHNRQIAIEEARAKNEAATSTAQADIKIAKAKAESEVIRANGVAEANKIIGESLQGNESYLHYLWIQGLNDGTGEVIYVPTEANLPIMEAGKRGSVRVAQ